MLSMDVGIIGYGGSTYEKKPSRSTFSYFEDAAKDCLERTGIDKSEVDGLVLSSTFAHPDNAVTVAEHLGLTVNWTHTSTGNGAEPIAQVMDAVRAVDAGIANHVLCIGGSAKTMAEFRARISRWSNVVADYARPLGFGGANGFFGMIQRKHMSTFGTTREQLGKISVDQRKNATNNPQALFRTPLTLDDYLNAPLVADPVRLYDCPLPASGADSLLIGPLDRAPAGKGVRILSGRQKHNHPIDEVSPIRGGWEVFRDDLYAEAGFGPDDMDFVQLYDDYPIMAAIQLEDLGFCAKGDIGHFLETHNLTSDGDFPLNTGGGMLSCGQTSAPVWIVEAIRQLRGEGGARQVADATIGLTSGFGMISHGHGLSATAMILERTR